MATVDTQAAVEVAKETFDAFRRDYLVASVVVLLLVNSVWAWGFSRVWKKLSEVQDQRVDDQIKGEARAAALADRMAAHMDRGTETGIHMLRAIDELLRQKQRKSPEKTQPGITRDEVRSLGGPAK